MNQANASSPSAYFRAEAEVDCDRHALTLNIYECTVKDRRGCHISLMWRGASLFKSLLWRSGAVAMA